MPSPGFQAKVPFDPKRVGTKPVNLGGIGNLYILADDGGARGLAAGWQVNGRWNGKWNGSGLG